MLPTVARSRLPSVPGAAATADPLSFAAGAGEAANGVLAALGVFDLPNPLKGPMPENLDMGLSELPKFRMESIRAGLEEDGVVPA